MPFYRKISTAESHGGIWKITESWEDLCRLLPRANHHHAYALQHFKAEKRRLEYAAVRALLFVLTGEDKDVAYYPSGRPYLTDHSFYLSVSHTSGYAAVLLSQSGRTGVDIEAYSPRVVRLKDRIAGPGEKADTVFELLLHWSAKETAFKLLDEKGIDFTKHLRIEALSCTADETNPDSEGAFKLSYRLTDGREGGFSISYRTACDFVLTYAYGGYGAK